MDGKYKTTKTPKIPVENFPSPLQGVKWKNEGKQPADKVEIIL